MRFLRGDEDFVALISLEAEDAERFCLVGFDVLGVCRGSGIISRSAQVLLDFSLVDSVFHVLRRSFYKLCSSVCIFVAHH